MVGLIVLAVLLVLPRFAPRIPAILVGVVGATVASAVLDLASEGVSTVGSLPQGFPSPSFPWTEAGDVGPLLIAAAGITLVSLTDTIATATSFAAKRGDEVDPDQEMVGMGAANVAAGFFQGFAVSTSGSRTAVAEQSGAKSQLTGVIGAVLVAVLLLFLNSLLADLPQTALAAVVITAALSLIDLGVLRQYLPGPDARHLPCRSSRPRGVVFLGRPRGDRPRDRPVGPDVLQAELVAPRCRARVTSTGWTDGMTSRCSPTPDSSPGSSCTGGNRRLFFANAAAFRTPDPHLVNQEHPSWVVLQCEAITDIDVTAAQMLKQLDTSLNEQGVHLAFAEMRHRLQSLTLDYGLFETLDRDHFYPTLDSALAAVQATDPTPATDAASPEDQP